MIRVLNTVSMFLVIFTVISLGQTDTGERYDEELVSNTLLEIEGFVIKCLEDTSGTGVYHLQNIPGGIVTISSRTQPIPEVGEYLRITGTISVDSMLAIPLVIEKKRTSIPSEWVSGEGVFNPDSDGDGIPDYEDECPLKKGFPSNKGCPTFNYAITGLLATTVFLSIILIRVLLRLRSLSRIDSENMSATRVGLASSDVPDPIDYIEGSVIKFHAPPPDTLKLLPGYFEIVGGESKLEELRFFQISEEPVIETTIGRLPGEPYRHIQLQSHTVSRKQAKLVYKNGIYSLINYAPETSNPTLINGEEMKENETRVLEEGDRIEMGEVELIYHAH